MRQTVTYISLPRTKLDTFVVSVGARKIREEAYPLAQAEVEANDIDVPRSYGHVRATQLGLELVDDPDPAVVEQVIKEQVRILYEELLHHDLDTRRKTAYELFAEILRELTHAPEATDLPRSREHWRALSCASPGVLGSA